jgi:hypothetical protein
MYLRNIGIYLQVHTALHHRRPRLRTLLYPVLLFLSQVACVYYCIYYYLTPQSIVTLKANSSLACKESLRLLWKLDVHFYVHRDPPLDPNIRQMNLTKIQYAFLNAVMRATCPAHILAQIPDIVNASVAIPDISYC